MTDQAAAAIRPVTAGRRPENTVVDELVLTVLFQRARNQRNDDKRWKHQRERRDQRAGNARGAVARECRGVDADRAGRRFRNGGDIGKLERAEPVRVTLHDLLQKRQCGIAAADGEQTRLEKLKKQQKKYVISAPSPQREPRDDADRDDEDGREVRIRR